jgi:hypothetical protein
VTGCCPDLRLDDVAEALDRRSVGVSVGGRAFDASDDVARELEWVQFVLGEGPIADISAGSEQTSWAALGSVGGAWPALDEQLALRSIRTVFSLPLAVDDHRSFGAFTVYGARDDDLTAHQRRRVEAAAREASWTVAGHVLASSRSHEQRCGLHRFDLLDRAIGMVMCDLGISSDEAAARIRSHTYASGSTIGDVIDDLLGRRVRLGPH